MLSGALVWQSSYAAFTQETRNDGNTFQGGQVTLGNNRTATTDVMFDSTDAPMTPNNPRKRCITVTYSGNVGATVKLFGTAGTSDLAPHLNLQVEAVTAHNLADGSACDGATPDTGVGTAGVLYNGTLDGFTTSHNSYANGVDGWTVTGTGSVSRTYRFTATLQDVNAAQGKSATASFSWQSMSS
ncbi:hypothetical protein [Kineococcus sp. SYSU DK004]|uniref:hypothetical protein n=1 Tax=Kineococcus sp. SYSU DK004 TaxID=3383125 RepID=UPI003D7D56A3